MCMLRQGCSLSMLQRCRMLGKGVVWVVLVKVQNGQYCRFPCRGQLRFSLCSEAIITRCWFPFYPIYWFQSSSADAVLCLMPLAQPPKVLQLLALLVQVSTGLQLCCCVSLSAVLGFCSLFYTTHILQCMLGQLVCTVYAGIVCLTLLTCDWSQLHAGIVCLAYDWVTACWDSLSIFLHAGIVCLASLAHDWVSACWDGLSMLMHDGIACLASLAYDWVITNDCFNLFV